MAARVKWRKVDDSWMRGGHNRWVQVMFLGLIGCEEGIATS